MVYKKMGYWKWLAVSVWKQITKSRTFDADDEAGLAFTGLFLWVVFGFVLVSVLYTVFTSMIIWLVYPVGLLIILLVFLHGIYRDANFF